MSPQHFKRWCLAAFLASLTPTETLATTKVATKVKVTFTEALDPKDSVTSKKFQQEYERTIELGRELTAKALAQCGYEIEARATFFGLSDPLQALERGQTAAKEGSWLIVGPRRSNHYLLLVKGAPSTATVSLMASSDEIRALGPLHLSMVPANADMAKGAAQEASSWLKDKPARNRSGYVSIVAADCLACKDFGEQFDRAAKAVGIKKLGEFRVSGEEPDISLILTKLKELKPAFVLLPNYSHLTSFLIAGIFPAIPDVFFVGGDGWGALNEGFVENGRNISGARGFSVRGNPSLEKGLETFDIGKLAKTKYADAATTSSAMTILRIFDSLEKFLCTESPRSVEAFTRAYEKQGKSYFFAPWGVNVFALENQTINYVKSLKLD